MRSFEQDDCLKTLSVMAIGLFFAVLINLPLVSQLFDKDWNWTSGFPLSWLFASMSYVSVFFHELGHAVFYWFYGYVSLPSFDFTYGGGMTYTITGQLLILNIGLYVLLAYLYFQAKNYPAWQYSFIAIGIFHAATAYLPFHKAFCVFGGHLAQVAVAGFLLTRAWFDLAPRGILERFLNAGYGFAMIFEILLENWALLHKDEFRSTYLTQKDGHCMGDLDKLTDILHMSFSSIVTMYIYLAVFALIIPAIAWFIRNMSGNRL